MELLFHPPPILAAVSGGLTLKFSGVQAKAAPTINIRDMDAATLSSLIDVGVAFQPRRVRSTLKPNRRLAEHITL